MQCFTNIKFNHKAVYKTNINYMMNYIITSNKLYSL